MDWKTIFVPSIPIAEVILRGSMVYLLLFLLLRLLRREAGALGLSDLVVVVLIADAAQNAMATDYKSITEGAILVCTIAFWDYLLDWLSYRFRFVQRLLRPAPLLLIRRGNLLRRNMRQEMITEEELMGQLREQGVENVADVNKCYLEGDGKISVIRLEQKDNEKGKPAKRLP